MFSAKVHIFSDVGKCLLLIIRLPSCGVPGNDAYALDICNVVGLKTAVAIDNWFADIFCGEAHAGLLVEFAVADIFHVAKENPLATSGVAHGYS